ncbi:MAG: hypothetical protein ACYC2R_08680 [Burkholderiales bacterium]
MSNATVEKILNTPSQVQGEKISYAGFGFIPPQVSLAVQRMEERTLAIAEDVKQKIGEELSSARAAETSSLNFKQGRKTSESNRGRNLARPRNSRDVARRAEQDKAQAAADTAKARFEALRPEIEPIINELIGLGADVPMLLGLLKNPAVRALLTPPTELEKEVEALVNGKIKPAEYYPRHKAKDKEPPAEFLRRIYGRYVEAGCLYLDQLRAIDPGLVQALLNWDSYRGTKESAVLGRERERADKLLTDLPGFIREYIARAGVVLKSRQYKGLQTPSV